ncbi:Putative stationary phase protein [Septoria linicola]|uniref:Stationary phase protein n=1 Tax=Septoria linicola TaxID=215465 RepID=A0A9Q9AH02_9PEZI|nr:putative stationary phase protein [Septoria linicola]USW47469.1 Putative stationary phase protein [Septoria linicola]
MPPGLHVWHSLLARHAKSLKAALHKGLRAIDAQVSGQRATQQLEPIFARTRTGPQQPLHPLARIRQSQSRHYSTARRWLNQTIRDFSSSPGSTAGVHYDRSSFPKSSIASYYVQSSAGRAPFASTLRPNLTGGALGRTAGGYSQGGAGGARYFSHGPAVQSQVVQNVSQAMRAFFTQGRKAQYDGTNSHGDKRFRAISTLQEETSRKTRTVPTATPGSWIDFQINPTITALTPLSSVVGYNLSQRSEKHSLHTEGLLDVLSADFSRALKDLAAILNDLKRLSALGDLPITYQKDHLRVHFPGCDADSVERLCEELNVQRGTVYQDPSFDAFAGTEIALLFPFAPSNEPSSMSDYSHGADLYDYQTKPMMASQRHVISLDDMLSSASAYSTQSNTGFEDILEEEQLSNPWLSSSPEFQSIDSRSYGSHKHDPLEYQGFEGIYRFIEELDSVRR